MPTQAMRLIVASATLLFSTAALAIPPIYTFQTGLGTDDVGGSSDNSIYVTGAALLSHGLSSNTNVDLRAEISTIEWNDNDDRSGEELFLESIYNYTPGSGFQVSTYSIGLRYLEKFASGSEFDASTLSLLMYVSYRIDDRTNILGGLKFSDRDTNDEITNSYFVTVDFRVDSRWLLYSTLNIVDEDIDSDSPGCSSSAPGIAVRSEFAPNHHLCTVSDAAVYDETDSSYITLGASYVLTSFDTLAMSISHREYDTSAGTIDGDVISFDYFHRF